MEWRRKSPPPPPPAAAPSPPTTSSPALRRRQRLLKSKTASSLSTEGKEYKDKPVQYWHGRLFAACISLCRRDKLAPTESVICLKAEELQFSVWHRRRSSQAARLWSLPPKQVQAWLHSVRTHGICQKPALTTNDRHRILWPTSGPFDCANHNAPLCRYDDAQMRELLQVLDDLRKAVLAARRTTATTTTTTKATRRKTTTPPAPAPGGGRYGYATFIKKVGPAWIRHEPQGFVVDLVQVLINVHLVTFKKKAVQFDCVRYEQVVRHGNPHGSSSLFSFEQHVKLLRESAAGAAFGALGSMGVAAPRVDEEKDSNEDDDDDDIGAEKKEKKKKEGGGGGGGGAGGLLVPKGSISVLSCASTPFPPAPPLHCRIAYHYEQLGSLHAPLWGCVGTVYPDRGEHEDQSGDDEDEDREDGDEGDPTGSTWYWLKFSGADDSISMAVAKVTAKKLGRAVKQLKRRVAPDHAMRKEVCASTYSLKAGAQEAVARSLCVASPLRAAAAAAAAPSSPGDAKGVHARRAEVSCDWRSKGMAAGSLTPPPPPPPPPPPAPVADVVSFEHDYSAQLDYLLGLLSLPAMVYRFVSVLLVEDEDRRRRRAAAHSKDQVARVRPQAWRCLPLFWLGRTTASPSPHKALGFDKASAKEVAARSLCIEISRLGSSARGPRSSEKGVTNDSSRDVAPLTDKGRGDEDAERKEDGGATVNGEEEEEEEEEEPQGEGGEEDGDDDNDDDKEDGKRMSGGEDDQDKRRSCSTISRAESILCMLTRPLPPLHSAATIPAATMPVFPLASPAAPAAAPAEPASPSLFAAGAAVAAAVSAVEGLPSVDLHEGWSPRFGSPQRLSSRLRLWLSASDDSRIENK